MTDQKDPIARAVELLVYAPVGAGLYLADVGPSFVDTLVERGRAEVEQRLTTARSLGQVALAFGVPMLRQKVQARVSDVMHRGPDAGTVRPMQRPRPVEEIVRREPVPVPDHAPDREELPIPGYDALSASQVVERLVGLGRTELDAVHAYEAAHRQRRTILGKIEQLAG
jgi:hypothetical protein